MIFVGSKHAVIQNKNLKFNGMTFKVLTISNDIIRQSTVFSDIQISISCNYYKIMYNLIDLKKRNIKRSYFVLLTLNILLLGLHFKRNQLLLEVKKYLNN